MDAKKSLETLLEDWNRTIQLKNHVCFYGGSFNPWHDGHSACLQLARDYYKSQRAEVDIVVAIDNNPWKEQTLPDSGKLELYKRVKADSKHSLVYPGFLLSDKSNPTYDWLRDFKEKYEKSVDLLIGFDNFANFDKWKDYQSLLHLLDRLLVVSRQDQLESKDRMLKILKESSPNTEVLFLGNHDFEHLSSTALRNTKS